MRAISKSRRLLDLDEMGDMTDAEASEYEVAEMNDDSGEFGIDQILYECPKCHNTATVEFL